MIRLQIIYLVIFGGCIQHNTGEKNYKTKTKESVNQISLPELIKDIDSKYDANLFEEARVGYNELITFDSLNGEFYYKRGYCLAQLNRHEESVKDYKRSSEFNFRRYDSYLNLGIIYSLVIVNDSIAIHYFEMAIEERPESKDAKGMLENIIGRDKSI
ncbi:MAG: tetratricopeptide (TPR) repeat protein [Cyclobacteriaceae bacterium]|jgi:tetratricopeptide (TPR) repeat protein